MGCQCLAKIWNCRKQKCPPGDESLPVAVVVQAVAAEVDLTKTTDFVDDAPNIVTQVIADADVTKTPDCSDIVITADIQNTIAEDVQVPCQGNAWPKEKADAQNQGPPVAAFTPTHTLLAS